MRDDKGANGKSLPDGGLGILTDFITHQDTVTWASLSAFLAGEFALLLIYIQVLVGGYRFPALGAIGVGLTLVSMIAVWRSTNYLTAYVALAKKRCAPADSEIFDVKVPGPSISIPVLLLQVFLLLVWLATFYPTA